MGEMKLRRMSIAALRDSDTFVRINSENHIFYGGDQAWFADTVGQYGGCGTVAAADITAYLAFHYPELETLYRKKRDEVTGLAAKASGQGDLRYREASGQGSLRYREVTRQEFLHHMEALYRYVMPWKVPFVSKMRSPWRYVDRTGREWRFGWTFGVWPMGRLVRGVERFAGAQGVYLKGRVIRSLRSLDRLTGFLAESLERDCPVAMLIGRKPRYGGELVTRPDGSCWRQRSFGLHWVVVTELERRGGRVMVRVSTWGGWAWLDLEAWQRCGGLTTGLVTFWWGEAAAAGQAECREKASGHFFALNCKKDNDRITECGYNSRCGCSGRRAAACDKYIRRRRLT
ncbi:MAG: hypothetical protein Q4F28_11635 [Eubacteriales bacterium]|nr:hypothetical protein [Eubacteriales bacterium]